MPDGWTVLECRTRKKPQATFFIAEMGSASFRGSAVFGDATMWVPTVKDGESLLQGIRSTFPLKKEPWVGHPLEAKPPVAFGTAVLARNGERPPGSGRGTWTATKWMDDTGGVEFYVNWSVAEGRGFIDEKDETYREDLYDAIGSLLVRGRQDRGKRKKP